MEYINHSDAEYRCSKVFVVDIHVNRTWGDQEERVFSTRGLKCGLSVDAVSTQGYCYWHRSHPEKARDPALRQRLETAVKAREYLGEAFLAGGTQGAMPGDSPPDLDLSGATLNGAYLAGAYMEGTILRNANLDSADLRGAWLGWADLRNANMSGAYLMGTDCHSAKLAGADIWAAHIDSGTEFTGAKWGSPPVVGPEQRGQFDKGEWSYRRLKQHYQESGEYRAAGEFYYREMECARKQKTPFQRFLWSIFFKSTMGYGERPSWALAWMAAVILLWAFVVFPLTGIVSTSGQIAPRWPPSSLRAVGEYLSLSLITFATLGYGIRYPASAWGEVLAGLEALLGVLLTSLFLVSFGKKVFRG
jgi:hypothetical protein